MFKFNFLKQTQQRNLKRILPFGIIWAAFGFLYVLIEFGILGDTTFYPSTQNAYDFVSSLTIAPIFAFMMGLLFGSIEVFYLGTLFANRAFFQKILIKTAIYLLSTIFLLLTYYTIVNSLRMGLPIFDEAVAHSLIQFASDFVFWSVVIYAGVITFITLFVTEVSDYLGDIVINNFFTGRYHKPREEERIFMFLDMKSSTTIAERLGHVTYFRLLNKYYADISDAIIETSGEIYQYAGDEVIVSWSIEKGQANYDCIQCYFYIKRAIEEKSGNYMKQFGLVPGFKAGFNSGTVTTGQIGVLKKEIFFAGDVMNTAARIQASCKVAGVDILISEELASRLETSDDYKLINMGAYKLRGRQGKVNLFTVKEN